MCIAPSKLDCGTEIACRKCWQCKKAKVSQYVGRCIAESKFSKKTYAITLTYNAKCEVNSVTLVYKDVQDFLKRLRKKYDCRYIVCGEYGSAKGRAHWHIILFFKDNVPKIETDKKINWKYWPHGFTYFQEPDWKGFEYCLKYVLKSETSNSSDSHLAMSKKPPLGYQYFEDLAQRYVDNGLTPQNYFYEFGEVVDYKNRKKRFVMTGTTKENFMKTFLQKWEDEYDHQPLSDIVEDYIDKVTEIEYNDEELYERLHYKPVSYAQPFSYNESEGMLDKTILHEMEYEGVPIAIWKSTAPNNTNLYHIVTENDEWQEDRPEIRDLIEMHSTNKTQHTRAQLLRALWQD